MAVCVFSDGKGKYYVRTEFGGVVSQAGVFETFEEARICADLNAVYGYRVFDASGKVIYTTYTELAADILREAKYVTDYVRENNFTYGDAPVNPAVDCSAGKVSCDRLVCWVMYNVGFTGQPETSGLFVYAGNDPRDLPSWCERNGFLRITDEAELMPGDIVFVHPHTTDSGITYAGHTFIHAGKSSDGLYYRYDCGADKRIRSRQPFSEAIINFMYAYRPVKRTVSG